MFAFSISVFFVSLGAMLRFGSSATNPDGGISVRVGGGVIMLAGIIGLLVSVQFWKRTAASDVEGEAVPDDPVSVVDQRAQLMSEPRRD